MDKLKKWSVFFATIICNYETIIILSLQLILCKSRVFFSPNVSINWFVLIFFVLQLSFHYLNNVTQSIKTMNRTGSAWTSFRSYWKMSWRFHVRPRFAFMAMRGKERGYEKYIEVSQLWVPIIEASLHFL